MGEAATERRKNPAIERTKSQTRTPARTTCGPPTPLPRDEEVDRLLSLGARLVHDHRGKYGPGTVLPPVVVDEAGTEGEQPVDLLVPWEGGRWAAGRSCRGSGL